MAAVVLMTLSAAIVFALGLLHVVYTFWGTKLTPRDPALRNRMGEVPLVIARETTMWQAWVGFNASHGMGAMLFGLVYGFLAMAHGDLLFQSPFLLVVGLAMAGGLFALGKLYWFSIPAAGTGISLACYVASILMSHG